VSRLAKGVVEFIDDCLAVNEHGRPFRLRAHQRRVLRVAFDGLRRGAGKVPWQTIVYSCPKKSGKTTINAAIVTAWAFVVEPPNEIYLLANDLDQARGRVYATVCAMIRRNPDLLKSVVGGERGLTMTQFELVNGTVVKALAAEASTAAGSNHGLVSFDELWAYRSERARLLWAELTPVPTRRNSVRLVTTYAGYVGDGLLWDLYVRGVGPEESEQGRGRRIDAKEPLYADESSGLLVYWDHEGRMPWQTPAYYAQQRASERPSDYLRYHENRWAVAAEAFVTLEQWEACVDPAVTPVVADPGLPVVVGVDGAVRKDSAGVVGVTWDPIARKVRVVNHAVWYPGGGAALDLEATVEQELLAWRDRYHVAAVVYDPYQLETIVRHLEAAGLPMERYDQTQERLTAIGKTIWDLLDGRNLVVYPNDRLREHALNAVALETPRGFRIAKDRARKKIDLFVALAMAAHRCLQEAGVGLGGRPLSELAIVGAERTAEISDEADRPWYTRGEGAPWET
jgi:phage terminase large subunit-like protein